MKKPLKIGVTGGIGSGKSIVSRIFGVLGIPVYDSDRESKRIISDPQVQEEIKRLFGEEAFPNGKLDNPALARIVFSDSEKLGQLNAILHPRVRDHFLSWADDQSGPYIVKEAAILFESGAYKDLDDIIAVSAPEKLRIERVMQRDNVDEKAVKDRMSKQMSEEERNSRAGFVILNDGDHPVLDQILDLHKRFAGEYERCRTF